MLFYLFLPSSLCLLLRPFRPSAPSHFLPAPSFLLSPYHPPPVRLFRNRQLLPCLLPTLSPAFRFISPLRPSRFPPSPLSPPISPYFPFFLLYALPPRFPFFPPSSPFIPSFFLLFFLPPSPYSLLYVSSPLLTHIYTPSYSILTQLLPCSIIMFTESSPSSPPPHPLLKPSTSTFLPLPAPLPSSHTPRPTPPFLPYIFSLSFLFPSKLSKLPLISL